VRAVQPGRGIQDVIRCSGELDVYPGATVGMSDAIPLPFDLSAPAQET
jgi:hypothetical protein